VLKYRLRRTTFEDSVNQDCAHNAAAVDPQLVSTLDNVEQLRWLNCERASVLSRQFSSWTFDDIDPAAPSRSYPITSPNRQRQSTDEACNLAASQRVTHKSCLLTLVSPWSGNRLLVAFLHVADLGSWFYLATFSRRKQTAVPAV